jgi:SUMO ligase MMS21 Smc5/6 complex component
VDLRQSLTRLHAELSATSKVDEASRRLMGEVLNDIERLLRERQTTTGASAVPSSRLEGLAIRFDSAHPALSASLREFVDLLGRAGL